jgi:hypothetical protein
MNVEDHEDLYNELKKVIYTRGYDTTNMTPAQSYFVAALESAAFGEELLKIYAELVDNDPEISLRNLHAFILGFGIGLSGNVSNLELTKSYH